MARDLPAAVRWYRRAAESGSRHAQCIVGLHYLAGHGTRRDLAEAVAWLRRSAEQNYPLAQYSLGTLILAQPDSLKIPAADGIHLLEAAAAQDHLDATVALARALAEGAAVPRDLRRARQLLRAASDRGHLAAARELAETYVTHGLRADWSRAAELFRTAAHRGDAWAQFRLGECYLKGLGVPRDARRARHWLERAAAGGVAAAINALNARSAA
jgi:TPR repeat protein